MSSNKYYAELSIISKGRFTNKDYTYHIPNEYIKHLKVDHVVEVMFNNIKHEGIVRRIFSGNSPIKYKVLPVLKIKFKADKKVLLYAESLSNYYINPIGHTIFNYLIDELAIPSVNRQSINNKPTYFYNIDCTNQLLNSIDQEKVNVIYSPSLKSILHLKKLLKKNNTEISYFQAAGGRKEKVLVKKLINNANNGVFIVLNTLIYIPFFNKDNLVQHFWDTNNYKYTETRKPNFNLIDVANIQSNYSGHDQYFYSEFPDFNYVKYFDPLHNLVPKVETKYYYDVNLKNALIHFLQDIKLSNNEEISFNLKFCSIGLQDELKKIINEHLLYKEYIESDNITKINVLVEPTISLNNKFNSNTLSRLIRYLNILKSNNSKLFVVTTKNSLLLDKLTDRNINTWCRDEFKYRSKYGPNYQKKVIRINTNNRITDSNIDIKGPINKDKKQLLEYEFIYSLEDVTNKNYFNDLHKYTYSFINYF